MLTEIRSNMEVLPTVSAETEPAVTKIEHCHRRKTRRGKKKRFSSFVDDIITEPENVGPDHCSCGSKASHVSKPYDKFTPSPPKSQGKKKRHLRPSYSPKAPQNSTQFLMEDHLGNQSFEENLNLRLIFGVEDYFRPNQDAAPVLDRSPSKDSVASEDSNVNEFSPKHEPTSTMSSPLSDLDYDYGLSSDWDSRINFYEQDFEEFYKNVREAELATKTRDELIKDVVGLEKRLNCLESTDASLPITKTKRQQSQDLSRSETLLDLQNELKQLQEENRRLREEQEKIV